ncbi:MAG: site-2 protease family protein [Leptospiraceae bacterium]|nr:site-2 protease family protein [Leptospiraceae bacterium]MDW8307144.1 site-2 protease family protein [Leptospiraceae bacterium]
MQQNYDYSWSSFRMSLGYSIPLMIILTGHEMGHYVMARLYGVSVSLPYFIPLPFISPFGTMGAFIRMHQMPPDRRSLFDIGFWGPAMSFLLSLPFLIIGISLSHVQPIPHYFTGLIYGDSLLIKLVNSIFHDIPPGHDIVAHPMALAAWTGLFVTALNLLPIGQLDGGHISYALLGRRQKEVSYMALLILFLLSLYFSGWFFLGLILIFMGLRHPPLPAEFFTGIIPLDTRRLKLAWFSFLMLVLCFVPVPIQQYHLNLPQLEPYQESPHYEPEDEAEDPLPMEDDEYHIKNFPKPCEPCGA